MRIVLSGHAERDAVARAVPVAHQFSSKPCDSDVLRSPLDRLCDLQSLLTNTDLRAVVAGINALPAPPSTRLLEGFEQLRDLTFPSDEPVRDLRALWNVLGSQRTL